MSDDRLDPIDERAARAGAGLRSTPVAPGDPQIAHRRVMRRRIAAFSTSALVAAAAIIIAIVVSTRDQPIRVYTPATVTPSLAITTTSGGATSTPVAPTAPPSTATTLPGANAPKVPEATNFPALIVGDHGGLRVTPSEATTLGLPYDTRVAFRLSTCAAFAYQYGSVGDPRVGIGGGDCPAKTQTASLKLAQLVQMNGRDAYRLAGVGIDGGHDQLLLGHSESRGLPAQMFDVQTGASRSVAWETRSVAGGVLIRDFWSDVQGLEYHAVSSNSACDLDPLLKGGVPSCTDDMLIIAPHGARTYTLPDLDPTGERVAFVDMPAGPTDEPDLVLRDLKSGQETFRLSLPWPANPTFLDFDGRWVAISRDGLPPLVIDTKATTPTFNEVSNASGMVTFDR